MSDFLYQDQLDPDAYIRDLTPGTSGIDLSDVTTAVFNVHKPNGDESTWATTLTNQSATTLTLTHLLVAGDIDDQKGNYVLYAVCTLSNGKTERSAPRVLTVKGKYEV